MNHLVIETPELDNPDYARNPVDRCYYCKTILYDGLVRSPASAESRPSPTAPISTTRATTVPA